MTVCCCISTVTVGVRLRIEQRRVRARFVSHDAFGRRPVRRHADARQEPELRDVVGRAVRHRRIAEHLDDVDRMVRRRGSGVVDGVDGVDDGLQIADEVVEADRARRQALCRERVADWLAEVDRLRDPSGSRSTARPGSKASPS